MMKKITFLFALLTISFGYSQTLPFDFSNTNQAFTWDASGGAGGAATINETTDKLELFGNGQPWDNAYVEFAGGDVVDLSVEAANTVSFTIDPLGTLPAMEVRTHLIRLTTTAGNYEVDFTTTGDAEQTILINPAALGNMTELRIFIDRNSAATGDYAIDDIQVVADPAPTCDDGIQNGDEEGVDCGGTGGCPDCPEPTTAAPTPSEDPNDVVSVFSDAYTDATPSGINIFNTGVFDNFTIVNPDDTRSLSTTNSGGGMQYEYISVSPLDISGLTHFHIDYWIPNGTTAPGSVFQIFIQNWPNHPAGGGAEVGVVNFDVEAGAKDVWVSEDVELGSLSIGAADKIGLIQLVIAGPVFGPVFIDNIYFYNEPTAGIDDFGKNTFKVFPNPTQDSWTVKTQSASISSIRVFDVLGKNVLSLSPNRNEATIDGASLNKGLYFAQIETASGISSLKLIKQ